MTEDFWNSEEIRARYTSVKPLGTGGMGTVYLVKDTVLDKLVAIKVLDTSLTPQQSMRFQREGKLSGKLNHANIVSVLHFGISEKNVPYLVMEYLPGKNLGALLNESGPLELEEGLQIFIEICAAMIHSHAIGILHRDLKPENIIVSETSNENDPVIKIFDFGVARLTEDDAQLTQSGSIVGSPWYMAPEQTAGNTDERSDIYSMGCLMFATLTGAPPFVGDNALETLMLHKSSTPSSLTEAVDRPFSEQVEQIVAKCLRKNPDDRYQSFTELQEDLLKLEPSLRLSINQDRDREIDDSDAATHPVSTRRFMPLSGKTKLAVLLLLVSLSVAYAFVSLVFSDRNESHPVNHKTETELLKTPNIDEEFQFKALADPKPTKHRRVKTFITTSDRGSFVVQSQLTSVNDTDLSALKKYSKIDKLILRRTKVTGTGFKNWNSPLVTALYLDGSTVSSAGFQAIRTLPGLQSLYLLDVELTPEYLHLLATGSNLSTLYFSDKRLEEQSLAALSDSKTISTLLVGDMQISEKGVESLLAIKKLNNLKLKKCSLTDLAFKRLQKPNKLENVTFVNDTIDQDKLAKILQLAVPQLSFVDVTMKTSVLKLLRGDTRITFLKVTSPGITIKERADITNSFPKTSDININSQPESALMEDTVRGIGLDSDYSK